jgi:hypothetical protein
MSDKDYGENRDSFALYPSDVTVIFDEATHRMLCKDGRGRVKGSVVKTMAERHKEWHERRTKDEMALLFKKQYEDDPLDYITNPWLFEQDIEFVHEFAGELSDECTTALEGMREEIAKKHKAYNAKETYYGV